MKTKSDNGIKVFITIMCIVTFVMLCAFTIFSYGLNFRYQKVDAVVVQEGEELMIEFPTDNSLHFQAPLPGEYSDKQEGEKVRVYYDKSNPTYVRTSLDTTPYILTGITVMSAVLSISMMCYMFRKPKNVTVTETEPDSVAKNTIEIVEEPTVEQPAKRRGRPKKTDVVAKTADKGSKSKSDTKETKKVASNDSTVSDEKKVVKRGRPKKVVDETVGTQEVVTEPARKRGRPKKEESSDKKAVKKSTKRGRPKKPAKRGRPSKKTTKKSVVKETKTVSNTDNSQPVAKKRGRPRKNA